MWFRILYLRSGELFTLLMSAAIIGYLLMSLSGSSEIRAREQRAVQWTRDLYLYEVAAAGEKPGDRYLLPSELAMRFTGFEALSPVSVRTAEDSELYSDGSYYYFFALTRTPESAESYLSSGRDEIPQGYRLLAWPHLHAVSGEVAYYLDEKGILAVTSNERALYSGLNQFPFDFKPAQQATERVEFEGDAWGWTAKEDWSPLKVNGTGAGAGDNRSGAGIPRKPPE